MIDINCINTGDKIKIFDYGNEIYDEIVKIIWIDTIDKTFGFERKDGEKVYFSGQDYFEKDLAF